MDILDFSAIQSLMLQTNAQLVASLPQQAIIIHTTSFSNLNQTQLNPVFAWFRQLPFPVVGFAPNADTVQKADKLSVAANVDAIVTTEAEAKLILQRIQTNPQAAAVLVQVLRAVEYLPMDQGLQVESMGYAALQTGNEFTRWLANNTLSEPAEDTGPAVLIERLDGTLNVTLNRPNNDNAYNVAMRDGLVEAFTMANLDGAISNVHVSAFGRCFCTGGELREFGSVSSALDGHLIRAQSLPARLVLANAKKYHFHVHRACVGSGLELPAFAGRVTADPKTVFWRPELSMGLIPGAGGCVSLTQRIGRQKPAYLVLMNKKIDAKTALDWGLIDGIMAA
ncbi:MAG: enoyl-CoA hydratase/isomerase family protein [Pseudomonadales bacterium]|nr:enoyl-CoA hydratase/isomerase family protein [Pseudomonadales bacterium]